MNRDEALVLLKKHIKNKNLIKHMLATEVIMIALAEKFNEDKELWGLTGLVHDIDLEKVNSDMNDHGLVGAEILAAHNLPEVLIHAVKSHADKAERDELIDKTLFATDPLTGLIVAGALIHPSKSLFGIDTDFILNRFAEKHFARGANRDNIKSCEGFGMELSEFVDLGLKAMQGIAGELGLK